MAFNKGEKMKNALEAKKRYARVHGLPESSVIVDHSQIRLRTLMQDVIRAEKHDVESLKTSLIRYFAYMATLQEARVGDKLTAAKYMAEVAGIIGKAPMVANQITTNELGHNELRNIVRALEKDKKDAT